VNVSVRTRQQGVTKGEKQITLANNKRCGKIARSKEWNESGSPGGQGRGVQDNEGGNLSLDTNRTTRLKKAKKGGNLKQGHVTDTTLRGPKQAPFSHNSKIRGVGKIANGGSGLKLKKFDSVTDKKKTTKSSCERRVLGKERGWQVRPKNSGLKKRGRGGGELGW